MIQTLLSDTVQHILLMKKNSQNEIAVQLKEKRLKKQKSTATTTGTSNSKGNGQLSKLLPWNVLLRIVIRLVSHTSKLMSTSTQRGATDYCNCHTKSPEKMNKFDEDNNDAHQKRGSVTDTKSSTVLHPILQALDIILSEIQVSMRVLASNSSTASSPPVTKEEHHDKKKKNTKEDTRKSMNIPQDQFLYNWKSHFTNETTTEATTTLTSSYYWGPSRYEFLKDVESITLMLHREGQIMGINVTEWSERINSIVDLLDEQYGMDNKQRHHHQQQYYSSPLKSKSASNVDGNSTPSSPLANITRDHVKRILHSAEVENDITKRRRSLFQLKNDDPKTITTIQITIIIK